MTQHRELLFPLIELRNPGKTLRSVIPFTPVVSLPPHHIRPLSSLSYSKCTSGGFSCNSSLWVLSDRLNYPTTNRECQLNEHGALRLLFYQVLNIISKFCFFTLTKYRHLESHSLYKHRFLTVRAVCIAVTIH